jgi:tRNA threonylcarbamoyladenosine biosynthesis protein TsaB
MGILLNIETSTEVCSVTVAKNGITLCEKESVEGLNHSELLTVFIGDLFRDNGITFRDLDAVAVSKGPGSYTGLRIGISVAKGISYAMNIPLISVGSLDALASWAVTNNMIPTPCGDHRYLICPMTDARRMEVYTARYNEKAEMIEPVRAEIIGSDSFKDVLQTHTILLMGNGAEKCRQHLTGSNFIYCGPFRTSARFMQMPAEEKYKKNEFEDVAYFEPYYLKDFIATIPKNKIME